MTREMKDSGIEWIGEIPKEWEIKRIKYVAEFEPKCNMNELNNDSIVTYLPMECLKNGYFEKRERNLGDLPTSLTHFEENDIVMAKVTPCFENGNIAIMQKLQSGFGLGSSELFVLRCKTVNIHYLFWWLQNRGFVSQACSTMTGTGGLKRVSPYFMKNCVMHMPPEIEQVRISNFLYAQCAELDNVLEKTCASIEEYKKLKQAVITKAVTKGIIGNREMKDSGVEWIGKIPSEWKIIRIKWVLSERKEKSESGEEEPLSMSQKYGIVPTREMKMIPNMASSFIGAKIVYGGDLVFNKLKAHLGVFAVSQYNGIVSPDYAVYCTKGIADVKYLEYLFKTPQFISEFRKKSSGVGAGLTRLYTDELYSIYCLLPSWNEQEEIICYLNKKMKEIDNLIEKKEQYLSEIENYKKSLIYECVTGKKEV